MDLVVLTDETFQEEADPAQEVHRSVTLTNDQWLILSQCVEAFSGTYRKQHSQTIATYVTRGQLDIAVSEAQKMNALLMQLDKLQAAIM